MIDRSSLLTLEAYAKVRPAFRRDVMEHKKKRMVTLGAHIALLFEDELTIRYQIQEMLRIERTFEDDGIQEEIDAYGPLVPDGRNLKATMMIQYADEEERRSALRRLLGIERCVGMAVGNHPPVFAVADEDLDRETGEKTSAVHFLRFELSEDMARAFKAGSQVRIFVEHANYTAASTLDDTTKAALSRDLS